MRTEDDLRTALTALERHAPAAARVLPGLNSRSGVRSPIKLRWVAGLAATAAVVGAVTGLTLTRGTSSTSQNGGVASAAPITKSSLRAKLLAAFSAASGEILYEYGTVTQAAGDPPVVSEVWTGPVQPKVGQKEYGRVLTLIGGKPYWDMEDISQQFALNSKSLLFKEELINISYVNRTWSEQTSQSTGGTGYPIGVAADILEEIKTNNWKVVGSTTFDGRAAIEVSYPGVGGPIYMWVDAHSYLPLHLVQRSSDKPTAEVLGEIDMKLIPATAANLAKLTTPIPAGFRRIAIPGTTPSPRPSPSPSGSASPSSSPSAS